MKIEITPDEVFEIMTELDEWITGIVERFNAVTLENKQLKKERGRNES